MAETFRWASVQDAHTLDPHASTSETVFGLLSNVYEGLVRRDRQMQLEPALAESWDVLPDDAGWRFRLRQGVSFHNGSGFTADDVAFSFNRASVAESALHPWLLPVRSARVIDDYTIDFMTDEPAPWLPALMARLMIMDRDWADASDATLPTVDKANHASMHANGTGAFQIIKRDPGVRTELAPFAKWWDVNESNISSAVFTPVGQSATGMAALLSGEIDFVSSLPFSDVSQMKDRDGFNVYEGLSTRVIMFGFRHTNNAAPDTTQGSDRTPFSDVRVRRAVDYSIDKTSLLEELFQDRAQAAGQLISDQITGFSKNLTEPLAFDPDRARALLTDAGYPDGVDFELLCPRNYYINDEALCNAVQAMMAQTGLNADITSLSVQAYRSAKRAAEFEMYLFGWSPAIPDAEHTLRALVLNASPDMMPVFPDGSENVGGYSNLSINRLLGRIQIEKDPFRRQSLFDQVNKIIRHDMAYMPLYVEPLVWASADDISLSQRADDVLILRWVTVN